MNPNRNDLYAVIRLAIWLIPATVIVALGHASLGMLYANGGMAAAGMDFVVGTKNKLTWFAVALCAIFIEIMLITLAIPFAASQFIVLPIVCFFIAFLAVFGINGNRLGQLILMALLNCYMTLTVFQPSIIAWVTIAAYYFCGALITICGLTFVQLIRSERDINDVFYDLLTIMANYCRLKINYLAGRSVSKQVVLELVRRMHNCRRELVEVLDSKSDMRLCAFYASCVKIANYLEALFIDRSVRKVLSDKEVEYMTYLLMVLEEYLTKQVRSIKARSWNIATCDVDKIDGALSQKTCEYGNCEDALAVHAAWREVLALTTANHIQTASFSRIPSESLWTRIKGCCNWQSEILQHAIKLSLTAVLSLAIGWIFHMERYYYIVMMALLMIKPFAAGTWQMFRWRLVSTVCALFLALIFVEIQSTPFVGGIAVIAALACAQLYIRRSYLVFNTALTFAITVFACTYIKSDVHWLLKLRLQDTFIGMGLALVVTFGVFPRWEVLYIKRDLAAVWHAQVEMLNEYLKCGAIDTKTRILAVQKLERVYDAWMRMLDEPFGQKCNYDLYAEVMNVSAMINRACHMLTVECVDTSSDALNEQLLESAMIKLSAAAEIASGRKLDEYNQPFVINGASGTNVIPCIRHIFDSSLIIADFMNKELHEKK